MSEARPEAKTEVNPGTKTEVNPGTKTGLRLIIRFFKINASVGP